jgi:hypothetical protein
MVLQEKELIVIRGLLIPMSWSQNGNITELGIAASDEQDYILEFQSGLGAHLSRLRKEVEVHGMINRKIKDKKVIKVKKIKSIIK